MLFPWLSAIDPSRCPKQSYCLASNSMKWPVSDVISDSSTCKRVETCGENLVYGTRIRPRRALRPQRSERCPGYQLIASWASEGKTPEADRSH